jgi:hypothetical protein
MTAATTQQICVAVFHSYCRPIPNAHNVASRPVPTTIVQQVRSRNQNWTFLKRQFKFKLDWIKALNLPTKYFIDVQETLDLTDSTSSTFAKKFRTSAETLDLTDTTSAFAKKFRTASETLDLTDTTSNFAKKFRTASESLDLVDTVVTNKIPAPSAPPKSEGGGKSYPSYPPIRKKRQLFTFRYLRKKRELAELFKPQLDYKDLFAKLKSIKISLQELIRSPVEPERSYSLKLFTPEQLDQIRKEQREKKLALLRQMLKLLNLENELRRKNSLAVLKRLLKLLGLEDKT